MVTDRDFYNWLTDYLLDKEEAEAAIITRDIKHIYAAWKRADVLNKRHYANAALERLENSNALREELIVENLMLRQKVKENEERDMTGYQMPPKEEIKQFLIHAIERGNAIDGVLRALHSYVYNDEINTLEDIQRHYPYLYKSEIADLLDKARSKHDI
jgi:hypothetical protein